MVSCTLQLSVPCLGLLSLTALDSFTPRPRKRCWLDIVQWGSIVERKSSLSVEIVATLHPQELCFILELSRPRLLNQHTPTQDAKLFCLDASPGERCRA
eukprot:3428863-Rhodomonas_salina.1